jgi:hypothetical protein
MKAANTQTDMNLDFNGMAGNGVNRGATKFAGNQHAGVQNPNSMTNKGRGPTVGNKSDDLSTYPDAARRPKFTPGKDMFPGSANPQVRTPGGTRAFDPQAGQNYKGNADRMNAGPGPTKGNV